MHIKDITKAGALVAGALLACQGAQASINENGVYMGFQNTGASADYIVNLGSLSSIIGQTSVVDLSSDFSLSDFSSVYGTGSSATLAAVVGAANNSSDAFGTALRTSNIGDPAVAGSTDPNGTGLNHTQDNTVYADISSINAPASPGGQLDTGKTWSSKVSPTQASGNYYSAAGFNPNSTITTSSVLYEDLYLTTDTHATGLGDTAKPFVYEGYFTIDFTGSTPDVTFTGADVAVPEPATYGVLAGVGMLLLAMRRQLTGIIA
jgi:hypothetical protein